MAFYKEPVSGNNQKWIHDLVRGETLPELDEVAFDPQQAVEESTIDLLGSIRDLMVEFAEIFNTYSEAGIRFQEIKVYHVAQSAADFMLYRNQLKLVVANVAHGIIQFSLEHHSRGAVSINGLSSQDGNLPGTDFPQEIHAQVGPFRNVFWMFKGERVSKEDLAKYLFSEFSSASREHRLQKSGNQLLLDQVKALLNEKGLDL